LVLVFSAPLLLFTVFSAPTRVKAGWGNSLVLFRIFPSLRFLSGKVADPPHPPPMTKKIVSPPPQKFSYYEALAFEPKNVPPPSRRGGGSKKNKPKRPHTPCRLPSLNHKDGVKAGECEHTTRPPPLKKKNAGVLRGWKTHTILKGFFFSPLWIQSVFSLFPRTPFEIVLVVWCELSGI